MSARELRFVLTVFVVSLVASIVVMYPVWLFVLTRSE